MARGRPIMRLRSNACVGIGFHRRSSIEPQTRQSHRRDEISRAVPVVCRRRVARARRHRVGHAVDRAGRADGDRRRLHQWRARNAGAFARSIRTAGDAADARHVRAVLPRLVGGRAGQRGSAPRGVRPPRAPAPRLLRGEPADRDPVARHHRHDAAANRDRIVRIDRVAQSADVRRRRSAAGGEQSEAVAGRARQRTGRGRTDRAVRSAGAFAVALQPGRTRARGQLCRRVVPAHQGGAGVQPRGARHPDVRRARRKRVQGGCQSNPTTRLAGRVGDAAGAHRHRDDVVDRRSGRHRRPHVGGRTGGVHLLCVHRGRLGRLHQRGRQRSAARGRRDGAAGRVVVRDQSADRSGRSGTARVARTGRARISRASTSSIRRGRPSRC